MKPSNAQRLAEYVVGMEAGLQPESEQSNGEVLLVTKDWNRLVKLAHAALAEGTARRSGLKERK